MADIGTGATVAFTGLPSTYNIVSIAVSDVAREAIDTSHLGTTTARTFIGGDLYDPGTVELEVYFDTELPNTNDPPILDAAATLTITFPLTTGATTGAKMQATAFLSGFSFNVGLEEIVTATLTFKLSGAITWVNEV